MKSNAILASALFLLIDVEGWAQLPETLLKTTPSSITIHLKGAELIQSSSLNLKAGGQRVDYVTAGLLKKVRNEWKKGEGTLSAPSGG